MSTCLLLPAPILDLYFEGDSDREITWLSWHLRFRKAPFSRCFLSTLKRKACVVKFRFEERFRKASFSVDNFSGFVCMDGRPNLRNKAVLCVLMANTLLKGWSCAYQEIQVTHAVFSCMVYHVHGEAFLIKGKQMYFFRRQEIMTSLFSYSKKVYVRQ